TWSPLEFLGSAQDGRDERRAPDQGIPRTSMEGIRPQRPGNILPIVAFDTARFLALLRNFSESDSMQTLDDLIEAIHQEALRADFPVDESVYRQARRDPKRPILYAGSLSSP